VTERCRVWVYAQPLDGELSVENFALRECAMPEPKDGETLVRVKLINLHSATRNRMLGGSTKLGETDLSNYACAQELRSRDPVFREGDLIACQAGWQDHEIIRSDDAAIGYPAPSAAVQALNRTRSQWTYVFRPEMAAAWSPAVLMDVFGTSGMTAWFGLRQCGPVTPTDVVAVGGTTGSVGAIIAQLAKAAGAHVIGFARDDRCRWVVDTLGLDHCLDYAAADLDERIG
jgi:NADPH-dependent curcumin reductase CurA